MPYKNTDDKRRWEQEHREQRNAQRRQRRSGIQCRTPEIMPDPVPAEEKTGGWKIFARIAVGIGVVLISAIAGASQINGAASGSEL